MVALAENLAEKAGIKTRRRKSVDSWGPLPAAASVDESFDWGPYGNTFIVTAPGAVLGQEPKSRHGAGAATRVIQPDLIGYADGINLYSYVESRPLGNVDASAFKKLTILAVKPEVTTALDFGYDDIIRSRTDIDSLWKNIRAKVGKFDAAGKCGNCIRRLVLKGHGISDDSAQETSSRYIWITGENPPARGEPPGPMNGQFLLGTFGNNKAKNPPLYGGTAAFFAKIKALECQRGFHVTFMGCNTGTGAPGHRMLKMIQLITGGAVTGYNTSINMLFGYPVIDLNSSGSMTLPSFSLIPGTVSACEGGNIVANPMPIPG